MTRTIAIGDIHGCSDALASVLRTIDPKHDDTIICLGDYVDRGADSKGVLDMLIRLAGDCQLIPILGNHDVMMLKARENKSAFRKWMEFGGITTLDSYEASGLINIVPDEHFIFLKSCLSFFETDTHFFVHANYDPLLPLDQQDAGTLRWLSLQDYVAGPHVSGKIAVVGHTPQPEVLNLGHLICLDTGCGFGGKLTAMEMKSGEVWQAGTMQQREGPWRSINPTFEALAPQHYFL
jgi:serine/threonine protein phosphatase 1